MRRTAASFSFMRMRGWIVAMVLAGCSKPSAHQDPVVPSTEGVVDAGMSAPATPPSTELSDDDIAALTLDGYDSSTHHVKTLTAAPDAGPLPDAYKVRASTGAVVVTYAAPARGVVHVVSHRGEDWAAGHVLAWVIVGEMPSLCSSEQGFLVLLKERTVVALAPWTGSCVTTPHHARFDTVQGRGVLLEEDGDAGEEGVTGTEYNVWVVSQAAWKNTGRVARTYEETRDPYPVAGYARKMDAAIAGTPAGLAATETWHFEPLPGSAGKRLVRKRTQTYTLHGDTLTVPPSPYPTP
jgi:hypothetical protein